MIFSTTATLTRQATRLTVLISIITLSVAALVSTAHSKPTAKPSFNTAAKGTKPSYTQPKPVMRPPTSRPRSVRTTPTARKMRTQKSPVNAAPRARTSTATARNLRKSVATPGKSRSAKSTVALAKRKPAGSKGSLRKATGQKKRVGVARPAKSTGASRPNLRSNTKKSNPQHQKKAQLGRAVGAPKASRNKGPRLTKAGKASSRARSGATRGPHASTIKVKTNNQSKRSMALAKGSKATAGSKNQGLSPKSGTYARPAGVSAKARIRNTVQGGTGRASGRGPDFIVSPGGTAFPVPKGAIGPTPVVNRGGKTTGSAFTGGKGGSNRTVDTMRVMNPTPARGKSPGYPKGYIKYENKSGQGVDPYTGRTLPQKDSHFPID